jgi:hypothetical protein
MIAGAWPSPLLTWIGETVVLPDGVARITISLISVELRPGRARGEQITSRVASFLAKFSACAVFAPTALGPSHTVWVAQVKD